MKSPSTPTTICLHHGKPALQCTVQGKICFLEYRQAKSELRVIRESNPSADHKLPQRTYECPHCGYWHLTSQVHRKWAG